MSENYVSTWHFDSRINDLKNDINTVKASVATVEATTLDVKNDVRAVYSKIDGIQEQIDELSEVVEEFVRQSERQHNIQVAEQRIVKIRQEVEHLYGNYEKIRRTTVGILQAVDLGVVKKDTINFVSDEFMLTTPKYWLAPCLVKNAKINNL